MRLERVWTEEASLLYRVRINLIPAHAILVVASNAQRMMYVHGVDQG